MFSYHFTPLVMYSDKLGVRQVCHGFGTPSRVLCTPVYGITTRPIYEKEQIFSVANPQLSTPPIGQL